LGLLVAVTTMRYRMLWCPRTPLLCNTVTNDTKYNKAMPYFNSLRLRRLRHLKRMSLADVSRTTGITKAQLSLIENGKVDPRISTVIRILECYGCVLADLGPSRAQRRTMGEVRSAADSGAARLRAAGLGPSDSVARLDRKDRLQQDTTVEREAMATRG